MHCRSDIQTRFWRRIRFAFFAMAWFLIVLPLPAAQGTNSLPAINSAVITNLARFWEIPQAQKSQLHRIQVKLLIYCCDPQWNVFWGASDGMVSFLPFRGLPVHLKAGDEVYI